MPNDPFNLEIIHELSATIRNVLSAVPITLDMRPAFPAINVPDSGDIITASQTKTTDLTVGVSSNRPDIGHFVDLLDADTMTPFADGSLPVVFAAGSNTSSVKFTIPVLAAAGRTTYLLQCRAPTSIAGNVHRILIDIEAPAIPAPPTVALGATALGLPLLAGNVPHLVPGLNHVRITATTVGGTAPFTYHWTVTRTVVMPPTSTATATDTTTPTNFLDHQDFLMGVAAFPIFITYQCTVTDNNGLNSPLASLSFTII